MNYSVAGQALPNPAPRESDFSSLSSSARNAIGRLQDLRAKLSNLADRVYGTAPEAVAPQKPGNLSAAFIGLKTELEDIDTEINRLFEVLGRLDNLA